MMNRTIALASILALLLLGACGTDDVSRPDIDATDTTSTTSPGGAASVSDTTTDGDTLPSDDSTDGTASSLPNIGGPDSTEGSPTPSSTGTLPQPPSGDQCPEDFGEESACGGDITGTWNIREACTDADLEGLLTSVCPDATLDLGEANTSGTLTITESEWDRAISLDASLEAFIPQSCLDQAQGFIEGCADLEGLIGSQLGDNATCVENDGGCHCTGDLDVAGLGEDEQGAYTQRGGRVAIDGADDDLAFWVCADEDTLYVRDTGEGAVVPATIVEVYERD